MLVLIIIMLVSSLSLDALTLYNNLAGTDYQSAPETFTYVNRIYLYQRKTEKKTEKKQKNNTVN